MVGYDHGFHLLTTPLWINAQRPRELSVVTHLTTRLPPRHRRVVASVALADLLGRLGYGGSVLPAAWQRPIGVAGETLELIDAGGRSGASAVLVEKRGQRVLVAGPLPRAVGDWPRADTVAGAFPALGHAGLPIETIVDELVDFARVAQAGGSRSIILVDLLDVGLELLAQLKERDVPLHTVGALARVHSVPRRRSVMVSMALVAHRRPEESRILGVHTGVAAAHWTPAWCGQPDVQLRALQWLATPVDVRRLVAATGAECLWMADVAPEHRRMAEEAAGAGVRVRFVTQATQLALATPEATPEATPPRRDSEKLSRPDGCGIGQA